MILRILHKIEAEDVECVLIVPVWKSQPWFPKLTSLLVDVPVLLPKKLNILHHPISESISHPILQHSRIIACRLSGKFSSVQTFRQKLVKSSSNRGDRKQYAVYIEKWTLFCVQLQKNPFPPSAATLLNFLHSLKGEGLGYSSLCLARSAIASLDLLNQGTNSIGNNPMICRYLKGIFHQQPRLPEAPFTWDPNVVLDF